NQRTRSGRVPRLISATRPSESLFTALVAKTTVSCIAHHSISVLQVTGGYSCWEELCSSPGCWSLNCEHRYCRSRRDARPLGVVADADRYRPQQFLTTGH